MKKVTREVDLDEFLSALRANAEYWGRDMGGRSPTDFAHAVTFGILNIIDGTSGDTPYDVAKEGQEPFNASTYLHEMYYEDKVQ